MLVQLFTYRLAEFPGPFNSLTTAAAPQKCTAEPLQQAGDRNRSVNLLMFIGIREACNAIQRRARGWKALYSELVNLTTIASNLHPTSSRTFD
jgi:hypothetical protein